MKSEDFSHPSADLADLVRHLCEVAERQQSEITDLTARLGWHESKCSEIHRTICATVDDHRQAVRDIGCEIDDIHVALGRAS